ncbi:hypothetical protein QE152_g7741 [Popillia japonica]|uniref:Uncharacterized protein n=1 Tax=Popillia japonica TaxID=7064 RepID=A0AAW1MD93_POPJA
MVIAKVKNENSEDNIDDRDKIMFGWNDEEDEERRAASSEIHEDDRDEEDEERRAASSEIHEDDREETSPGIYVKSSDEDFVVNLMIW